MYTILISGKINKNELMLYWKIKITLVFEQISFGKGSIMFRISFFCKDFFYHEAFESGRE